MIQQSMKWFPLRTVWRSTSGLAESGIWNVSFPLHNQLINSWALRNYYLSYKTLKKLCGPFLWMDFNCLKEPLQAGSLFFNRYVPRNFWYSFCRPRKDEGLSRPFPTPANMELYLGIRLNSLNIRNKMWRQKLQTKNSFIRDYSKHFFRSGKWQYFFRSGKRQKYSILNWISETKSWKYFFYVGK